MEIYQKCELALGSFGMEMQRSIGKWKTAFVASSTSCTVWYIHSFA